ncbi:Six-hairpin glycosidase [Phaeosphaeriaceae sp. SRC1lsM3a]|nr:Six-hairpin glycosidase [Stagonospora sp. SRC1lsM3a]
MNAALLDTSWIWHPDWVDSAHGSSGGLVHFRKTLDLASAPAQPFIIQVTADTKYKLYINQQLVVSGPVKGDDHLWFYDEVDIQPYLRPGLNHIAIRVLRLFHAAPYATSFPRLPIPGLFVRTRDDDLRTTLGLQTDDTWEAGLDTSTVLRVDQQEDHFLHVYESVNAAGTDGSTPSITWTKATVLKLPTSYGSSPPWVLSPRLIPPPRVTPVSFDFIHNVRSPLEQSVWEATLLGGNARQASPVLTLPPGTLHHVELELPHHLTALPTFRFRRPQHPGSRLTVTYSEAYEDTPDQLVPWVRKKGDRRDASKHLMGPQDIYYTSHSEDEELFSPFHFRTLRFMALDIRVCDESGLELLGINLDMTHYPLDVLGKFDIPSHPEQNDEYQKIWANSVRTLTNCMHDCYEDCPFYEQLQYAMDVRSSCLFTYAVSGDDRMARQAITQLHNSYRPSIGLVASRSPSQQLQIIPHFSLFWICTVTDHFEHAGDAVFTRRFLAACDGIFETFARRIDPALGLIASDKSVLSTFWDFVDWAEEWVPTGIPPAAATTGFMTFTNMLYVYTLRSAANMVARVGRPALSAEYTTRADSVVAAIRDHCRLDEHQNFFTDGLAVGASLSRDLSEHTQVWAVLSGVVTGDTARELLACSLYDSKRNGEKLTRPSMAMSFYTLRALSAVGGSLYNDLFHAFWAPWRSQVARNLTTWCEDDVSQRSDCHAWSCAPLYELMVEVAGVRCCEPGWDTVIWKPRVALFPSFDAHVPLGGRLGPGVAHVSWGEEKTEGNRQPRCISLTLELHQVKDEAALIRIELPDGRVEERVGPSVLLQTYR